MIKIMIAQCCHICPWWHHDCLVSPDILAHCCHNDDQSEDCTAPIWPMRGLLNSNQHVLPQILSPEMVWVCDADTDWDMGQELSSVETMGPGPGHWDPVCQGVWGVRSRENISGGNDSGHWVFAGIRNGALHKHVYLGKTKGAQQTYLDIYS